MTRTSRCWCGNADLAPLGPAYLECPNCRTLIVAEMPHPDISRVRDDERDFYGRQYWFSHQEQKLGLPNILHRSRADLPERCLHWLRALLKYKSPPAKVLELGSAHGGFVALLRRAGFDATGLELSPWVAEFASKTFDVPILVGPVEDQAIAPASLDAIVLMDVLEHLPDPVGTMRHCLTLLAPDGVLLLQTPRYPEGNTYEQMVARGDRFLELLKPEEHVYLFSRRSIRQLFHQLGVTHLAFEPAIFAHYDMCLVVGREPLVLRPSAAIEEALSGTADGRVTQALLDLEVQVQDLTRRHSEAEADRAAQREAIAALTREADKLRGDLQAATDSLGWRAHHWARTVLMRRSARSSQDPPQALTPSQPDRSVKTTPETRPRPESSPARKLTCVAVDLTPVLPGGENGGAKLLATELVRYLGQALPHCEFVLLTSAKSHDELAALDSPNVRRLCVHREAGVLPTRAPIGASLRVRLRNVLATALPAPVFAQVKRVYRSILGPSEATSLPQGVHADLVFCPFTAPPVLDVSVPVVAIVYDLQFLDYPQFFGPDDCSERQRNFLGVCRRAARIVTISDFVRSSVLNHSDVEPERVVTIHIRLRERLKDATPAQGGAILDSLRLDVGGFLLYPANFWPHKNHRMLLTAFGIYRACHLESVLKLVCTGALGRPMEELRNMAQRMGLSDWVCLPGYVSDAELATLFRTCRAVIFPSLYEGFGMPVLEAMAFGKPVLCSNTTSLPEVAGDAALLFDPRTPLGIVSAIEQLESDAELVAALPHRGRRRLAALGGPREMVAQYLRVFHEAIRWQSRPA